MKTALNILSQDKTRKIIISVLISSIAFQGVMLIHTYGVNTPFWDDWDDATFIEKAHEGKSFWDDPSFVQRNEHRVWIPYLIVILDSKIESWNSVHLMYFSWGLMVVSIWLIYGMLKDVDLRLTWLSPLLAAFLFSPSQYETFLWGGNSIAWCLTTVGFISSVYFLNKIKQSHKFVIPAILLAIVSTFSLIQGLLIWPIGLITIFLESKSKKIRLLWSTSAFVIFAIYFINYSFHPGNQSHFLSLNYNFGKFVSEFISNGLVSGEGTNPLLAIIGTFASICILGTVFLGYIYHRIKKRESRNIIPWFQFAIFGMLVALMTASGRVDFATPLASRYVTLSNLLLISSIVIGAFTLLQYRDSLMDYKKKIVVFFIFFLVAIIILGLAVSYYLGWTLQAPSFYSQLLNGKNCLLEHDLQFDCPTIFPIESMNRLEVDAQIIQSLHLGPFAKTMNIPYVPDPLLNETNWTNMVAIGGKGVIGDLGPKIAYLESKIIVNKTSSLILISGWGIFDDKSSGTSAYVFVDNLLNRKIQSNIKRPDISMAYGEGTSLYSGYEGLIDVRQLTLGCHDISVRIVKNNAYHIIISNSKLCVQ